MLEPVVGLEGITGLDGMAGLGFGAGTGLLPIELFGLDPVGVESSELLAIFCALLAARIALRPPGFIPGKTATGAAFVSALTDDGMTVDLTVEDVLVETVDGTEGGARRFGGPVAGGFGLGGVFTNSR